NISDAYGNDADLILYYSGHGMPDDRSRKAYLLPSDGIANDPESGYALSQLYDELGEMKFNSTLVLLDACFSGAKRDGKMLTAAKGVAIKPSEEELSGNVAVISATQGDDTAYPDDDSNHGLFTYFLLKRLQETKGYTTIGDLASYISTNVKRASLVKQNKMQVPAVNYSPESTVDLEIVNFGQK
ncbi:MAG: caspase family protein, partial [Muribaculaceae bacterium]|nr:caspase family protein [Muribaculaceae bacterium]